MASSPMFANISGNAGLLAEKPYCRQMLCGASLPYAAPPDSLLDGGLCPSLPAAAWLSPRAELPGCWGSTTPSQGFQMHSGVDDNVAVEERNFKDAMREYERTAKEKYKTGICPDDLHTVRDLEVVVAGVIDRFQPGDSHRSLWNTIRLACRKLAESKENVDGWLGLLPGESVYLSVVCGGLKLVLSAAARFHQVQGRILEALVDIPTILNGAKRVLRIYRDSTRLVALSKGFYMAILGALGYILHYLQRHAVSKIIQVMLQPASFQRDLLQKIDRVRSAREAFNAEADICEKEMLGRLETAQRDGNRTIVGEIQNLLNTVLYEGHRANLAIQEGRYVLEQGQAQIYVRILNMEEEQKQQGILLEEVHKYLQGGYDVLRGFAHQKRQADAATGTRSKRSRASSPPSTTHDKEPVSQLRPDLRAIETDILAACRLGPLLAHDDQERSVYVARSPRLAAWLTAAGSAVLLVNGHAPRVQRRSALTFVCGRLAAAFEQIRADDRPDLVPLTFFCGEHVESSGHRRSRRPDDGGLVGVVQGLLAQLLARCPDVDVGPLDCSRDLHKAWKQLVAVLRQLPASTTVLCMVDGLSGYLDEPATESDAEYLVRGLLKLAHASSSSSSSSHKSKKPACAVKLLLTAPNRMHAREAEALDDDEVLDVPARLARTGGFVEMKWHMDVEQQLETLR